MKISHCEDHLVSRTQCFEPNTGNWYFPLVYLKKNVHFLPKVHVPQYMDW